MSMNRFFIRTALLLVSIGCFYQQSGRVFGDSYEDWLRHREAVLKDPAIVRYYTFDNVQDAASKIPNLAGKESALSFAVVPGGSKKEPQIIEGRWPRKKALHLDRGYFYAKPFDVKNKSFTVEAWIRTNGVGAIRGDAVPTGGTMLSVGVGYWDGWRITIHYPDRIIGFDIGRPKPVNAVGIRTDSTPDGVWHHLAATWDGKQMALYLDGLSASVGEYSGAYTPPARSAQFRVGYAGYGWGSTLLDVDEVAIYSRALSPMEILRSACLHAPLPDSLKARLEAADRSFNNRDYQTAADEYAAILHFDAHPNYLAAARLRLGQVLIEEKRFAAAVAELSKILQPQEVSEGLRKDALTPLLRLARQAGAGIPPSVCETILARDDVSSRDKTDVRLNLARSYRQQKNYAAAEEQYRRIAEMKETPPREKLNIRLQIGHTAMEARDYSAARSEYAAIVADSDGPIHFKSYARLLMAESYVKENKYEAAKAEYVRLLEAQTPRSHQLEAEERIKEINRLKAGLAPRDRTWSRTQLAKQPPPAVDLYIAPNGDAANPGTKKQPFATLKRAQEAIRALKRKKELTKGGITVHLKPGDYQLDETFKLTSEDSGSADIPIVYRADEKGAAHVAGGVRLKGFKQVRDPAVLARLPDASRGKVLQLDLKARDITDYGELRPRGFGCSPSPAVELFFDGKPMQLARWPNKGFVKTGKVIDPGSTSPAGGAIFEYGGDRPSRWLHARDVWLFGYWHFFWADGSISVASIDPKTRRIKAAHAPHYGMRGGQPYYAFNLLEEIDAPGEWYLDRASGILYFYPPSNPDKADVQLSMLNGPMVNMEEVSHVTFRGLVFELCRGAGVVINGGAHCLLAGCTFRYLGGDGVIINGGVNHGVLGCDIHTLGRGGTRVVGGDRKTLTPGGHFVENCHIYDFSRIDRTYTPAVLMDGVGDRIAHNLFHDSPCHGIRLEGNDHVVEFNEVHRVVMESDDQGGLDMFFNPTYRGNILRYNFWHDIGSGHRIGQAGIRLDDAISGTIVYGNVFYRCSSKLFGGVQIHGGKENVIENNIFVDCRYAISFSPWGERRWKSFLASERVVKELTETVDISKPPYSTRYPALAHLSENPDVNYIWRNLVYNCGGFLTRDRGMQELMDNYVTTEDPGFLDPAHLNFQLKPGAPVYDRIGFREIPFEEIGPYQDELRATWPIVPR